MYVSLLKLLSKVFVTQAFLNICLKVNMDVEAHAQRAVCGHCMEIRIYLSL